MKIEPELLDPANGIYSIRGKWLAGFSFFPTRCFVINGGPGSGVLVIDTCGPGSGGIIAGAMKAAGINPGRITGIALTHWHRDHTGGLAELVSIARAAGAGRIRIFIHKKDSEILRKGKGCFFRFHPKLNVPIYHVPGRMPDSEFFELIELEDEKGVNPLDTWGIVSIHAPGHTPGNTSFLHRESGSLFSGCGLSLFGNSMVGVVPVFYDRKMQIASAKKIMDMDFTRLYPAHMNLRNDVLTRERRVPFAGRPPLMSRVMGTLPLFRYGKG